MSSSRLHGTVNVDEGLALEEVCFFFGYLVLSALSLFIPTPEVTFL